jgi:hypothetical protein
MISLSKCSQCEEICEPPIRILELPYTPRAKAGTVLLFVKLCSWCAEKWDKQLSKLRKNGGGTFDMNIPEDQMDLVDGCTTMTIKVE